MRVDTHRIGPVAYSTKFQSIRDKYQPGDVLIAPSLGAMQDAKFRLADLGPLDIVICQAPYGDDGLASLESLASKWRFPAEGCRPDTLRIGEKLDEACKLWCGAPYGASGDIYLLLPDSGIVIFAPPLQHDMVPALLPMAQSDDCTGIAIMANHIEYKDLPVEGDKRLTICAKPVRIIPLMRST